MKKQKLWTRDFTIITAGTVISMLGNAMSAFAIGMLVLDYTESVFLFATFMVAYNAPKVLLPIAIGPYLDRFSRRKMIYGLDFLSAAIYLLAGVLISYDLFQYAVFLPVAMIIGSIDSIYKVAYDSFYPTLVEKENYAKAFSVSSMILPLSAVMVPIAALIYQRVGLVPLFFVNAISFLLAAILETQIKGGDDHVTAKNQNFGWQAYREDFRNGLRYIQKERGLFYITLYFFIDAFAYGASASIILPYFKRTEGLGVLLYCFVMAFGIIARVTAGFIQYRHALAKEKRLKLSLWIYVVSCLIEGTYLFAPVWLMCIACLFTGFFNVIAYNLRISATQSYISDTMRARFTGVFQMITTFGSMMGQLLSGAMADMLSYRIVLLGFMGINIIGAYFVLYRHKEEVRPVYNQEHTDQAMSHLSVSD